MRNLKWSNSPSDCGLGLRLGKKRPGDIPRWYKYHQLAETLPGRVDKEQHWHCQPRLSSRVTHHISEIGGRKISDSLDYFLSVPVSRFSTLCPDEKRQIQLDDGNALQWWDDGILMTSPHQRQHYPVSAWAQTHLSQYCPLPLVITPLTRRQRQYFIKHIKHRVVLRISKKSQKLCMSNNMRSSSQV